MFYKNSLPFIFLLLNCLACQNYTSKEIETQIPEKVTDKNTFQEGDIIFQTSLSNQSKAIQLATHSPYSHCGIVYKNQGKLLVFEAIQPVSSTPLITWINRGKGQKYIVKRLKNAHKLLTQEKIQAIKKIAQQWQGKHYDIFFEWNDTNMYCSELVWKIYKQGLGVELTKLEKLQDFDLSSSLVKTKLQERYGKNIPYDELVVSPVSILNSKALETIENIQF